MLVTGQFTRRACVVGQYSSKKIVWFNFLGKTVNYHKFYSWISLPFTDNFGFISFLSKISRSHPQMIIASDSHEFFRFSVFWTQ